MKRKIPGRPLRQVIGSPDWCHICGLTIPHFIVDAGHPLAWTVDHVVPKSKGGSPSYMNRRAAHRLCNLAKGSRAGLSQDQIAAVRRRVIAKLIQYGLNLSGKLLKRAEERATPPCVEEAIA